MGAEWVLRDLLVSFLYRALVIENWVVKRSINLRLPQGVLKLTLSVNVHIGVHIMNEWARMHVGVGSQYMRAKNRFRCRANCFRMQIWVGPKHFRVRTVHVKVGAVHVRVGAVNVRARA